MTDHSVTDEQLGRLARRQHDLFRRVREGAIEWEQAMSGLQDLIEGRFPKAKLSPCQANVPDLVPEWAVEIVEDVEPRPDLRVSNFTFEPFQEEGEDWISGQEMRRRATERGADLGLSDARALLDQQANIPKEIRDWCIVLPGTVLRFRGGIDVPCLEWSGGGWVLRFRWLGGVWSRDGRFALSK